MSLPKILRLAAGFACLVAAGPAHGQTIVDEWVLEPERQNIASLALSPDGKLLAVGADNIHLYDLTTDPPRKKTVIESKVFTGARGVLFSPDSKRLAYGGSDNKVHLWTVDGEPKELSAGSSHAGDVVALSFSKDGKLLASGSNDRTAIVWKITDAGKLIEQTVIKKDDRYNDSIRAVGFVGNAQLVTVNGAGAVRFINLLKDAKYAVAKESLLKGNIGEVNVAVRPDGKTIAVSAGKSIGLTGNIQGVYQGHTETVTGLAFSPDGSILASCGRDGRLHMYVGAAKLPKYQKERPDRFTSLAFTPPAPDEKAPGEAFLAAGTDRGKVFLYKVDLPDKKK